MGCSQRGQCPSKRPVAHQDGAEGAAIGPEASHDLDEPIRLLLGRQGSHEYQRGFSCLGWLRPGMELGRVPSIGDQDGLPRSDTEPSGAFVEHLVTDGDDEFRAGHDAPPRPFVEQ